MNSIFQWIGTAVAILLATLAISAPHGPTAGNTTSSFWDASSYKVSGTTVLSATVLKTTTAGGTLTVTTSNAATSTAIAGCYQLYATSTANPIKLLVTSVATTAPTFGGTVTGLAPILAYGTCP